MEYFKFWLSNLTLTFRGHEAGVFHAFRVIIYGDLEHDILQFLC